MHDPMTVAFEIPSYEFRERFRWFPHLATIWHVDPEKDGSDDSCGWSFPRLTEKQREAISHLAWWEKREPWFQALRSKQMRDPVEAECLMRAVVKAVARAMKIKMAWNEVCEWASEFVHNPASNFRSSLCHLPGWHTNFQEDMESEREECARGLFSGVAAHLLRSRRPWWRHPRWHFWHLRLQVHLLQRLKRWLFSRCCRCGKGFSWGYAPTTCNWHGTGPLWFRSEEGMYHHDCDNPQSSCCVNNVANVDICKEGGE